MDLKTARELASNTRFLILIQAVAGEREIAAMKRCATKDRAIDQIRQDQGAADECRFWKNILDHLRASTATSPDEDSQKKGIDT